MQTLTTVPHDGPLRVRHAPDPTRYAPGPPAPVRGVLAFARMDAAFRAQRGRTTRTVVPSPAVLVSDTSPPWASTIVRTMDRPRPVPPIWRLRAFRPRW